MEKHFRFLLVFLLSIGPVISMAQKKDWSFSDRTGIKGIQFSLGSYQLMDQETWKNMLSGYVEETPIADSIYVTKSPFSGKNRAVIQLELVYAPFRFNSNLWLRNLEVYGGISHRAFDETIRTNRGGAVNENDFQYFERSYSLSFNHTAAQVRVAVNRSVLPSFMVYGTFGAGMGISRGLIIQSSEIIESYYSPEDSTNKNYIKTNFTHPGQGVFYQSKAISQQSISLGLKFYATCRLNIYAEYGMEFLQIHKPGAANIYQNSHGFQVGLRFKFNPPEPVGEEEKVKDDNVFW